MAPVYKSAFRIALVFRSLSAMYIFIPIVTNILKNNRRKSVAALEPGGALVQVRGLRGGRLESVLTPATSNWGALMQPTPSGLLSAGSPS